MHVCQQWLLLLVGNALEIEKLPFSTKSTALHHFAALTLRGGSA
jgi:hypothetical protein